MTARRRGTAIDPAHADDRLVVGSHRVFGWVMAVVAGLVALWAWRKGHGWLWWPAGIAIAFALAAAIAPALLAPLNRAWMAFGLLLGRIISPLVMGLIFFGVVTPIAVIARWRGVDPMRRRFDPAAKSYWIERQPPGPNAEGLRNQF